MRANACMRAALPALLILVASSGARQTRPPAGGVPGRAARPAVTDLIAPVTARDPMATLTAQAIGPAAAADLVPLTRDADEEVREIALLSLAETGGIRAVRAMIVRLNDPAPMVRAAALKGVDRQASGSDVPALIHALEATDDTISRRYLGLLIGRLGSAADIEPTRKVFATFTDGDTGAGFVTALAKLGDKPAQAEFNRRLGTAGDRELLRYLESAEQVAAPWLLPALVPLLANRTPLRWIGIDGLPGPENLRAADIAASLIAKITGHKFSFAIAPNVNYTDEQLAEVLAAAGH